MYLDFLVVTQKHITINENFRKFQKNMKIKKRILCKDV